MKEMIKQGNVLAVFAVILAVWLSGCTSFKTSNLVSSDKKKSVPDQVFSVPESKQALPESKMEKVTSVRKEVANNLIEQSPDKVVPSENRQNSSAPVFDVSAVNMPAQQFFMSLVANSHLNMVVHPEVSGKVSIQLKNVTLDQALAAVCDVYHYDFLRQSYGYKIVPGKLQAKLFKIAYLDVTRNGVSSTRVNSGQISNSRNSSENSMNNADDKVSSGPANSRIETVSKSDFWLNISESIQTIIGNGEGRRVVVSAQVGLILVQAYSSELANVQKFLEQAELSLLKQVVIEAKILEVELSEGFQAGIQWDTFGQGYDGQLKLNRGEVGVGVSANPVVDLALGGIFSVGLNFSDFNSVIQLLETQGTVSVLSSPRISTVNNQKAVIKVGTEEYFVTDISNDISQSSASAVSSTDVTIAPFFSGIALDVTSYVDDNELITLHVHPTITTVVDQTKEIGPVDNPARVPLAYTSVRESDSIVIARSGQVIVLGGLIQDKITHQRADLPWLSNLPFIGALFSQRKEEKYKTELVILLRPEVLALDEDQADFTSQDIFSSGVNAHSTRSTLR